ncbi:methyltransferase, partial [Escherichia coli]|nr:methyltransferase [Escherichia coli]
PEQVEAEVNYIRDNGQRPVAYTYPAPAGTPQRSALLQPTRVAIRNARLLR